MSVLFLSGSGDLCISTALLGGKKTVLSSFSWPDRSLSWHAPALGIGTGMCMGLLMEIYTKEAIWVLDACQGHFHPLCWRRGLGTTALLWNGSASWVNDVLNSHRSSKFTTAFVQKKKKKVKINFSSQQTCLSSWVLYKYLNAIYFAICTNYSHREETGETK